MQPASRFSTHDRRLYRSHFTKERKGGPAPITTSKQGTLPSDYKVTLYAFGESNSGNGSRSSADASIAVPLTLKE
jgi:hypothetical protein